jgi:lipopolysaccharide transport system permease protein
MSGMSEKSPYHLVIKPSYGWAPLNLQELWEYRELFYFLTWRDIKVRYKQTILGAGWAIVQPFMTMVVFSVFLGYLSKIPSDGIPYPIFNYAALVPWTLLAKSLSRSSNSLIDNAHLINKIYFPRMIIPISSILSNIIDFFLSLFVLLGMMFYFRITPTIYMAWLPLFLLLALATTLGVVLWLSALNVEYRDVSYTTPFLTQLWLFATPIVYPSSLVPEKWRIVYAMNPMVGVVEGFRWALLGTDTFPGHTIIVSAFVSLGILLSGAFYFRRIERAFADIV